MAPAVDLTAFAVKYVPMRRAWPPLSKRYGFKARKRKGHTPPANPGAGWSVCKGMPQAAARLPVLTVTFLCGMRVYGYPTRYDAAAAARLVYPGRQLPPCPMPLREARAASPVSVTAHGVPRDDAATLPILGSRRGQPILGSCAKHAQLHMPLLQMPLTPRLQAALTPPHEHPRALFLLGTRRR